MLNNRKFSPNTFIQLGEPCAISAGAGYICSAEGVQGCLPEEVLFTAVDEGYLQSPGRLSVGDCFGSL